jgi:tetratricopeptide (TPR) repeat protein
VLEKTNRSLELGDGFPQPHAALAEKYRWVDWDWTNAETEFKRAIAIAPDYSPAYSKYSSLLRVQRRFAEAEENMLTAIRLDPFSPLYYSSLCDLYLDDRKHEKAIAACRTAQQIDPEFWLATKVLFQIYLDQRRADALAELELAKLSAPERATHPLTQAAKTGDFSPYFQMLLKDSQENPRRSLVNEATIQMRLGDIDKTLELLHEAFETREFSFPSANADPVFAPLRNDRRFLDLMAKAGL